MTSELRVHFTVKGASDALDFYTRALGAEELYRLSDPVTGAVGHAEMRIGDHILMLNDEYPDFGAVSPETLGGVPFTFVLLLQDVDASTAKAEKEGAVVLRPPADEFHGHRNATILDPFGYRWNLSQKIEDVSPEEMQRRWGESTTA